MFIKTREIPGAFSGGTACGDPRAAGGLEGAFRAGVVRGFCPGRYASCAAAGL